MASNADTAVRPDRISGPVLRNHPEHQGLRALAPHRLVVGCQGSGPKSSFAVPLSRTAWRGGAPGPAHRSPRPVPAAGPGPEGGVPEGASRRELHGTEGREPLQCGPVGKGIAQAQRVLRNGAGGATKKYGGDANPRVVTGPAADLLAGPPGTPSVSPASPGRPAPAADPTPVHGKPMPRQVAPLGPLLAGSPGRPGVPAEHTQDVRRYGREMRRRGALTRRAGGPPCSDRVETPKGPFRVAERTLSAS